MTLLDVASAISSLDVAPVVSPMYGPGAFDEVCCSRSRVTGGDEVVAGGSTELADLATATADCIDLDDAEP